MLVASVDASCRQCSYSLQHITLTHANILCCTRSQTHARVLHKIVWGAHVAIVVAIIYIASHLMHSHCCVGNDLQRPNWVCVFAYACLRIVRTFNDWGWLCSVIKHFQSMSFANIMIAFIHVFAIVYVYISNMFGRYVYIIRAVCAHVVVWLRIVHNSALLRA